MGQTTSKPLDLILTHFGEVKARAHGLSVDVRKGKRMTFCSSEWPTFNVGWPPEGTFHLPTVLAVEDKVFQKACGHPDQVPYIVVWKNLVTHPPPWIKPFLIPTNNSPSIKSPEPEVTALMTETKKKDPKGAPSTPSAPLHPILQDGTPEEAIFPPPPYRPPPTPQPAPSVLDTLPPSGPAQRTRSFRAASPSEVTEAYSIVLPLRATGPPDDNGNQPHHYWPFATSDLYNWRTQNAKFSDNPRDLIDLLETVLFTHQPTWDDYQQLLQVLFTTEERGRIISEARKNVPDATGIPTTNQACIDDYFSYRRPNWDYNTAKAYY
ncbi:uncharacterized protein LOC132647100 isoform X3 [Meriones unguiculatus]|uniref:uncharacterized protein LOC132647100 isoform X3 n=1 Tax=Meriones unguiculatus TaxID=10047 RepID=UPI00293F3D16|nr:uncharacterized protein LOC132647100 isoform X3 [Meriones unguiculatus]